MSSTATFALRYELVACNLYSINFLFCQGEDLDSQQGVIDFSLYLRSTSQTGEPEPEEGDLDNISTVLDQKNYIEELNRHLKYEKCNDRKSFDFYRLCFCSATVTNLQAKVEALTTTNALMKEDLMIARNNVKSLQDENESLRRELSTENPHGHKSTDEVRNSVIK